MLTFDPEPHVYRWNGRVVPGVTRILTVVERGYGFVDPEILESARSFGKHMHRAIELFNAGELDEEALDPALKPRLDQWKQFLADTGFKVTAGEEAVYHPSLRYAGRLDVRGIWPKRGRDRSWLIDLKSGAVPRSCALQTAGYQSAANEKPRHRAALQLMDDRYNLIIHDDPADFSYFQSALNIFRFQNNGDQQWTLTLPPSQP